MAKYDFSESKTITFSDSIVIFTRGDTVNDACKILLDAGYLIHSALENGVAIKGALSFGLITVDFESSLFFGRPIIDAYLLHDMLQLYTAVLDYNIESKFRTLEIPEHIATLFTTYKANFKTGKITHQLIKPDAKKNIDKQIQFVEQLYDTVSGSPRVYVDNTLDFLRSLSA